MEGAGRRGWIGAVAAAVVLACPPAAATAQVPGRDADPVVLTGASLPTLAGSIPGDVVGFRWTGSAWDQVPVQVDERAAVPFNQIYNNATCAFACNYTGAAGGTVYTDPDTWTGADPDATLDANDEVAFMAKDSGAAAPASNPSGVVAATRANVELTDPISGTTGHFVYLFSSATLDPGAGESYVDYNFNLTSGDYKTTYLIPDGPNAETSTVETDFYRHDALTDRWFDRNLKILGRGSTEADILDGDKVQFLPSTCGRSETTFAGYASDQAEGAFVTNSSGPIRAIRSYLGANSGPSTQRTHIYYEQRQDVRTNLRVHAIPSIMSFLDYSPAANGMKYRNPANTAGVTINGVPDETVAPSAGGPQWEQVAGPQGTLDVVNRYVTDISPITLTNYWYDDSTPDSGHLQCSGDTQAWGSSGTWVTSGLPNTDPKTAGAKNLTAIRHMFYDAPNQTATQGALRNQQITSNLGVTVNGVTAIAPGPGVAVKGPPPPNFFIKVTRKKGRAVTVSFSAPGGWPQSGYLCRVDRVSKPRRTGAEAACASPHTFRVPRKPGRYELNVASLPNYFDDKVSIKVRKPKKRKKAAPR